MHQDCSEEPIREIPLKQWMHEQAKKDHVSVTAIWYRLRRNKRVNYPSVSLRSANKRVVFVRERQPTN